VIFQFHLIMEDLKREWVWEDTSDTFLWREGEVQVLTEGMLMETKEEESWVEMEGTEHKLAWLQE
jgi:hypothetical protein